MKILFITTVPPSPQHSGTGMRLYNVLRTLIGLGHVTLVTMVTEDEKELLEECRSLVERVVTVDREAELQELYGSCERTSIWQDCWNAISTLEPMVLRKRNSSHLARIVRSLRVQEFGLIWITKGWVAGLLPCLDWGKVVIDLDDLEHRVQGRALRLRPWYPTIIFDYVNVWKQKLYEKRLCKLARAVLVCSMGDKQILGYSNVHVVPNCVEVSEEIDEGGETPHRLLYVGNFKYAPNVDAALFFCKSILPYIRKMEPRAHLYIVGREPPKEVMELHNGTDVIVTGTVPDITQYFKESSVVIVPLRVGGGTRVKILEAFAHRKGVVSTTIGAEGLQVEDGIHLHVSDNPAHFAWRCLTLIRDPSERRTLGEAGRRLVETRYNLSIFQHAIHQVVSAVTRQLTPGIIREGLNH